MGKRSNFKRRDRDFYPTPVEAVEPLIAHLPERFTYIEPCSGDGALIKALGSFEGVAHDGNFCPLLEYASDIAPTAHTILTNPLRPLTRHEQNGHRAFIKDVFATSYEDAKNADFFITNPPWSRDVLHQLISHLSDLRPTWLLLDSDWMHTKQATPYLRFCRKIVSVGRVKWIPDSPNTGKDNCAWYLFDQDSVFQVPPEFWGRVAENHALD